MRFYIVRIATGETIQTIEVESFFEACKYVDKWYEDGKVDLYYAENEVVR